MDLTEARINMGTVQKSQDLVKAVILKYQPKGSFELQNSNNELLEPTVRT